MNDISNPQMGEMCTQPKVQSGEDEFHEMALCDQCPCKNTDYEQGCWCNLDFDCDLFWQPDGELVNASGNCGLVSVITKDDFIGAPPLIMARKKRVDRAKP